jgi:O-antigen biosynthesis protein
LEEPRTQYSQVISSKSWKITLPLRKIYLWLVISPLSQIKRYLIAGVKFFKVIYLHLPLSNQTKSTHWLFLAKHFPQILRASDGQNSPVPVLSMPNVTLRPLADLFSVASDINLKTSLKPVVSIIIPIYGKCDYTLRCLSSISANLPSTPFEVIVVNDCSPDNSAEVLQRVEGILIISNPKNQGFIYSCNIGAKAANGEYLYFLNNDTEVTPGWLDELIRTFYEFPGTGLAGSKLIYPDGTLQEAGGIIWQDGSALNFGHRQDPSLPIYNYAREVDYCSGASIMVPAKLFEELGGFDEHYLPAYCEDSDLAFKIRDKDYRVIYQPLSVIVHHEGVTSGTDATQGTKSFQVKNLRKQFQRWEKRLSIHQTPGINIDHAKDHFAKYRVLVIDHCTPTPNQDAGSVVTINLLLLMREMGFQITFIPEGNFLYLPDYTPALQKAGIEVLYSPYNTSVIQHLKESGRRYDLVFLFRPGVVQLHIKAIRKYSPQAKVLFHTVDLHFLRMQREAELLDNKVKMRQAAEMKQLEFAAIRSVDATIVVSTNELDLLRSQLPKERIHVFPLIMDIPGTDKGFKDRRDIVFIGGYQHPPNFDAVKYFANDIMPLLRQRLPGVCFYVVGNKPPAEIQALASNDVIITGFIEDLPSLFDQIRVSVAPLRYGAGIKGKIGTAMTMGLPTVATSLAAEGMSLTDGENIMLAEGAEAFASTVARLYEDEALWNRLSKAGLEFANKAWGAEVAWERLANILSELGLNVQRSIRPIKLFSPVIRSADYTEIKRSVDKLQPIFVAHDRKEYEQGIQKEEFVEIHNVEKQLIESANAKTFLVDGFCMPCNKNVRLLVDMQYGGQLIGDNWVPNWRERLECPFCQMNNRQRLSATLVKQQLEKSRDVKVYFMEQVTPIFRWAVATFPQHQIIGSEYLGYNYQSGQIIKGIRHEDVMNMSFADDSLDLIISNDVFEHVPNPKKAFAECARVLNPEGMMLATIPFHSECDNSIVRAALVANKLNHLLPPMFHGNPVSEEGSIVFTDYGWDVLDDLRNAGFANTIVEVYADANLGHIGDGQLLFKSFK